MLNKFNDIYGENFIHDKGIIRFQDSFDKIVINKCKKVN